MAPRRPRVVCFAPLPPPATGQSRVTASTVAALAAHADVEVVDTADRSRTWRPPGRVPLRRVAAWVRALRALRRAVRARPDLVYLTPASSPLGLVRDALSVRLVPSDVPVVAHVHVGDWGRLLGHPVWGAAARATARRFARVIVPSRYAARGLADPLRGVPVAVVPNAVPSGVRVEAGSVQDKWARARRAVPHVAFVSAMIPSKGFRTLAAAAARLEADGQPLQITFAGAWPSAAARAAFEAEIASRGGRWRVAGPLDSNRVRALLLDADAFAFPSTYPHESFGLAVLEAMQAGCGVAAVAHAAIGELVRDGIDGRLAASTPQAFAAALADVLAHRERYGQAAAERARTHFAPEAAEAALVHAVLGGPA